MRIPRFTRRRLAAGVTALTAAGLALALTAGPALANPQWNQIWYGNVYGQSNFRLLGNPSNGIATGMQIQSGWGNSPYLLCLDIDNSRYLNYEADGTQLQMWDCNGGNNQKFFEQAGADPGTWVIGNTNDSSAYVCLDAQDGWAFNGAPLMMHNCNSPSSGYHGSQEWTIGPNGQLQSYSDGVYYRDSLCADVVDPGNADPNPPADGTKVELWQCAY